MCELCDETETGEMQSCQDCGMLICFDVAMGDDVIRQPYVTASGDLYCDRCGRGYDEDDEATCLENDDDVDWNEDGKAGARDEEGGDVDDTDDDGVVGKCVACGRTVFHEDDGEDELAGYSSRGELFCGMCREDGHDLDES